MSLRWLIRTVIMSIALASTLDAGATEVRQKLLLISLDGFRWDYLSKERSPNLYKLARSGVSAQRLIPVFPTTTMPNHYTIVTGLYPEQHGIVANRFYEPTKREWFVAGMPGSMTDGKWWGGEPIWVTAERQGLSTATFFWPGSEAEIKGLRPRYWKSYDKTISHADRLAQVIRWLELPKAQRPRLITLYLDDVDQAIHRSSAESGGRVEQAIKRVDQTIGKLLRMLDTRELRAGLNIIVVSDHGSIATSPERVIFLDDMIDLQAVRLATTGAMLSLWPGTITTTQLLQALKNNHPSLKVFEKAELPAHLRYARNARIAPIIGMPEEGWLVITRAHYDRCPDCLHSGSHGYDSRLDSMAGIFVANGPGLGAGVVLDELENIHLYELFCALLDLSPAQNFGSPAAIESLLVN